MSALCGAAAVWGCARASATWARHLDEGRHGAIAAVVAGGALLASPLPWEYATHAEVFALNNALVAFGIWCAAALAAHPRDRRPARAAALLVGCCAAHQHASLLTAAPLAAFAVAWLRAGPLFMLELFAVAVAAWAYPTYKLTERSAAATEGSWGDLTTARGVFTHLTRYEYGTFRLGASAPGTAWAPIARVLAYFTWSLDQTGATVLALALVGAGAGALSKNRPARRAARAVSGAWALYTLLWHGIWSNLPIHEPSMAYEVHARFWMQPHLLVCVMAGAGAAAVAARAQSRCRRRPWRSAFVWWRREWRHSGRRWTSPPSLCSRRTAPPRSRRCRRAACYCRTRTSTGIRRATSAPARGQGPT